MNSTTVRSTRGFTLIELLVVIAIIGVLSSVVLVSVQTARAKSRDAKRIAEVGQIRKALELYYDANQTYPSSTPTGFSGDDAAIQYIASLGALPRSPVPPQGVDATYIYRGLDVPEDGSPTTECLGIGPCNSFELGVTIERVDNVALTNDFDQSIGTFYGGNPACLDATVGEELCFDVGP